MNNNIFTTMGASNHSNDDREENDFYATDPIAMKKLLEVNDKYSLGLSKSKPVWECASGDNHLANVLLSNGYSVRTSDLIKRKPTTEKLNFLESNESWNGTILTNPPYKYGLEFVKKALKSVTEGNLVIMFLKVLFLEGQKRKTFFENNPPKYVLISSSRINCAKNGNFNDQTTSSAIAYAWYVWEKGYKGDTIIKWF